MTDNAETQHLTPNYKSENQDLVLATISIQKKMRVNWN